jgi:hypothetical protein
VNSSTLSEARAFLKSNQVAIPRYREVNDLCVLSCHFNSEAYSSRLINFALFEQSLIRSGIEFIAVEGAFGDAPHQLDAAYNVHRVRAKSVMWQKERLLNVALAKAPKQFDKIAWIDADVVFNNPGWARTASQLLEFFPVVQLFHKVVRLPRGHFEYRGAGQQYNGFAIAYSLDPHSVTSGDFHRHGHTGFGWAARREVLEAYGLYDGSITGSGDDLMAHAFCGDWNSPCIAKHTGNCHSFSAHFRQWAERIYPLVRSRVGYVPGVAWHLWHGEMKDRGYGGRNRALQNFDFDPKTDISVGAQGTWEWSSDKRELHQWMGSYFATRREDG